MIFDDPFQPLVHIRSESSSASTGWRLLGSLDGFFHDLLSQRSALSSGFPSIFSEKKGRHYTPTRQLVKWLVVVGLGFGSLLGEAQMYHTSCSGGKMD